MTGFDNSTCESVRANCRCHRYQVTATLEEVVKRSVFRPASDIQTTKHEEDDNDKDADN